ncbi:putative chromosome segregation protein SudA [Dimargaris cristalligena]|uniref:Structural maintenance of chromosomes protein n=1 Tax=Dimargaris cristalligena TaxID=215637 RepID=A0A4V1J5Q4_9FUNG|nr:putative chromosome segregation protein SudA [Dimargaris cristalligena]|eukprot:RKP39869.1 putative chromosome segregation protein SudA [Dimargaris cristalligena]
MYIKQIIIQGFKSYKDQTEIEPFSPGHNSVVGRNGSGKSNFFAALRFVLSDAYTNMNREERQALLHEGSGAATMSAFVEVIFDNSDNRFPTGKPETIIRRTIGLKKDEYSLDKRSSSKTDIMNLLESAGFSRSNPYYIVPQGRVTSLTHAKDQERLQLLKEVAGTRVYETRRQESVKILDDTNLKRQKINEVLKFIEDRLAELEEEKEELKHFQELDRDRRCLEYTIYSREQHEIVDMLEELEEDRRRDMVGSNQKRAQLSNQEQTIADIEQEIVDLRQKSEFLTIEKQRYVEEFEEQIKAKAQLELVLGDLENSHRQERGSKTAISDEVTKLQDQIRAKKADLHEITPDYETALAEEQQIRTSYDDIAMQRNALLAKMGRNSQFKNQKDRNAWLTQEIESVQRTMVTQAQQETELEAETAALEDQIRLAKSSIITTQSQIEQLHGQAQTHDDRTGQLKEERDLLTDRRKDLWREEALLDSKLGALKEELRKAERTLGGMMNKNIHLGLQCVTRLMDSGTLPGLYGPLYQLFQVDPRYQTAVETIGHTSLFFVVVDSDATATQLLDHLKREKAGRVTVMPLNRLRPRPSDFPSASDAIPMVSKLQYASRFEPAIQQVFGKALICPTLEVAGAYARSHGLTGVTLEGDRVDKKGALTGGYVDTAHRSRLNAGRALQDCRTAWSDLTAEADRVRAAISQIDADVTRILSDIQRGDAQRRRAADQRAWAQLDLENRERELRGAEESLAVKTRALQVARARTKQWAAQVEALQTELRSAFASDLSPAEHVRLDQLGTRLETLSQQLDHIAARRVDLESRKNVLENELTVRLNRRLVDLQKRLESMSADQADQSIRHRKRDLKSLETTLANLTQQIQDADQQLGDHSATITELQQTMENARADQQERARRLDNLQQNAEKYLSKRSLLLQKKEECVRNIRELGVLPEEAFTRYLDTQTQKLIRKLHKVNEGLKKYSHVNKKAFDQYNNFTKQRDDLLKRQDELNSSFKAIEDLIQVLDQRKDEAIERTFKQVAKYFVEVFEKLVPSGKGQLIMQRRFDKSTQEEDDPTMDADAADTSVENYTGVAIKVSFNSKTDEGLRMPQLSGGQKSVVALALIFAIQRCDPAPFYLFDEIDANLDAVYRTAVAHMIHELSDRAQFITTTFRPEMLAQCDKFYGVTFVNKVSHVNCISKEDAMGFVEQQHVS